MLEVLIVRFSTMIGQISDESLVVAPMVISPLSKFTLLFLRCLGCQIFDGDGVEFPMGASQFFGEISLMYDDILLDHTCWSYGFLVG